MDVRRPRGCLVIVAALAVLLAATVQASGPTRLYVPLVTREDAVTPVSPDGQPSWGAPIAVSPLDGSVWVVNPDAGSVTMIDAERLEKRAEIPAGREPQSLAIAPDGRSVYVVDRAEGALVVVDASSHQVRAAVPVGPEPAAVALSPAGSTAYVTVSSAGEVVVIDINQLTVVKHVPVAPHPYAIAVTDDGDANEEDERVYVTHLLALPRPGGIPGTDDGQAGRVTVLNAGEMTVRAEISLA
ncbi:MAG: YncE family protein, partial [Ardenticatenaceae bacterium]